jgi:hypothetical protein
MKTLPRILTSAMALAIVFAPLAAQSQERGEWVVTPYVGLYAPANQFAKFDGAFAGVSTSLSTRHESALALGGTVNYWFTDRLAVEVGGTYAYSHLGGTATVTAGGVPFAGDIGKSAHVVMGTAKLMFALLPPDAGYQVRFGIGPAFVSRGGDAYTGDPNTQFSGLTNYGAAASLCTHIKITGPLSVRLRAEDYMYKSSLRVRDLSNAAADIGFPHRFQNDFVLSAGLQIGLRP